MTTRAEVETNNADFCAALGRGDIDRVVSSFDPEAVMLAPGAPPAHASRAKLRALVTRTWTRGAR